jgi:hypothetical protein
LRRCSVSRGMSIRARVTSNVDSQRCDFRRHRQVNAVAGLQLWPVLSAGLAFRYRIAARCAIT